MHANAVDAENEKNIWCVGLPAEDYQCSTKEEFGWFA